MNTVVFKKLSSAAKIPEYKTTGSAGADLCACFENQSEVVIIKPFEIKLIKTGLAIELPSGFEAQIRPRSGSALKGITIPNSPGTIDNDYRGELSIILQNLGKEDFTVEHGMRIAQIIFAPYFQFKFEEKESLSKTQRGEGGFGSTGQK